MYTLGADDSGLDEVDELDPQHRTDPALPSAKQFLLDAYFSKGTRRVYYQRQLQVLAENEFFHWITAFALADLVADGLIATATQPFRGGQIRYYWPKGYRDNNRATKSVRDLVGLMAEPAFAIGVGRHGETMVDAALPRIGMRPLARNVRAFEGREWTETGHDLDRVFELEGIRYGVEVKNQLQYIERAEFLIKLEMCRHLGLRPLFVMRMLPRSYMNDVFERGGYVMIMKYQLYPHGSEHLAKRVRDGLGLPVDAPPAIFDGTLTRFANWHRKVEERADSGKTRI